MADIELAIKIPEEMYKLICKMENPICRVTLMTAVANGIPLPKGHGDLIDKSKIYKAIPAEEDNCTGAGMTLDEMYAYNDGIDAMYSLIESARPIIEADNTESEELKNGY